MSKILVGIDASERSLDAVAFARDLANVAGASVMLACAYPYSPMEARAAVREYREALRSDAIAALARAAEELKGSDAVQTVTVADTSPARMLHVLADEEGAALTVVGSSLRGAVGRVLIGSTAMRLLRGSPSAVAVVPRGYRERTEGLRRIGVGYDDTDESRTALAAAAMTARALGAQMQVIGVLNLAVEKASAMTPPGYAYSLADIERSVRQDIGEAVAALGFDVNAEAVLRAGAPADVLAEQSQDLDLLFVGSRAYGPLRAVLLGSVTQRLLHDAACPVVVLPRGADEPAFERLVAQSLEGQAS